MLRKVGIITLVVAVTVLMAGCNLNKKIGDSITENIMEKAIGDDVEVEVDGEDISYTTDEGTVDFDEDEGLTIEGEDGTVMSAGSVYEWPTGQAADYLPKLDRGKIFYILNSDNSCSLMVEETVEEDYKSYVESIIDDGYSIDKVESSADDMLLYSAKSENGITVCVIFVESEGTMQISVDATGKTN